MSTEARTELPTRDELRETIAAQRWNPSHYAFEWLDAGAIDALTDAVMGCMPTTPAAEDDKARQERIRAYAVGHAHGQHRTTPGLRDWSCARSWVEPLTEEQMRCSVNPDRDHEWVVALDGDGDPLDYLHCGYCGVRKPS